MGHSSINVTLDIYGHLFPRLNDAAELPTRSGRYSWQHSGNMNGENA